MYKYTSANVILGKKEENEDASSSKVSDLELGLYSNHSDQPVHMNGKFSGPLASLFLGLSQRQQQQEKQSWEFSENAPKPRLAELLKGCFSFLDAFTSAIFSFYLIKNQSKLSKIKES